MGADLLIYICNVPGLDGDKFKDACKTFVDEMPDESVFSYFEDVTGLLEEYTQDIADELGLPNEQEPPEDAVLKGLRKRLVDDLVEARCWLSDGGRDLAVIRLGGIDYYMSGGLSWGDEPTDSCPYINKLAYTGADMIGVDPPELERVKNDGYDLKADSTWINAKNLSIYLKQTDEGIAVDIYKRGQEDMDEAHLAGCYAFFAEGPQYGCGNCGADIPGNSVRFDRLGNLYCPDCGSNEVGEIQED